MSTPTQSSNVIYKGKPYAGSTLRAQAMIQTLIVCDNNSHTEQLKINLQEAGLTSESENSMTAGCESAKSGQFDVVFSAPHLGDGSWKRLIDVAQSCNLTFEVIVLARSFNLNQWAEALQDGAFDVLDVVYDLPRAAESARRAFGAAYLRRFRSRPETKLV
jgi:DNA-binding NtrC family response regulator